MIETVLNLFFVAMASAAVVCIFQKTEIIPVLFGQYPGETIALLRKTLRIRFPHLACWLFCPWCIGAWVTAGLLAVFHLVPWGEWLIHYLCALYLSVKFVCWRVGG